MIFQKNLSIDIQKVHTRCPILINQYQQKSQKQQKCCNRESNSGLSDGNAQFYHQTIAAQLSLRYLFALTAKTLLRSNFNQFSQLLNIIPLQKYFQIVYSSPIDTKFKLQISLNYRNPKIYFSQDQTMEPQSCTKCNALPQDILMLACSHDLCLNCAADRLAFEMKKKKPANSIVCEFCYQRTPLDSESVSELQKLVNNKGSRVYQKSAREPQKMTKFSYDQVPERSTNRYQRTYERPRQPANPKQSNHSYTPANIITAKKSCNQHPQQQILYFCFDCKCQCICPQCVIHGKHKDHDVKTIKKSHPVIKAELQKNIDKLENNIESLLIKKSEVQKNIRSLNQQSSQSKRQIQQAFEQIKTKLELKQKEIIKTCDVSLQEGLEQLEKYSKVIIKRIDQIKHQCGGTQDYLKRDELTLLNFYARKWRQLNQETREPDINISTVNFPSNQIILASVLNLTDQIAQIGMSSSQPSKNGKY